MGWWELRKAVPSSLPRSLKKIPIPYPICTLLSTPDITSRGHGLGSF